MTGASDMVDAYRAFLRSKRALATPSGFAPSLPVHPRHFGFQRDIIAWALRQGRAAIFADTGLGKTGMQVEWARHVAAHTGGRVLILAPLAVAPQTTDEGAALGAPLVYARTQAEADAQGSPIVITNYDRVGAFDGRAWAGVVLDESSILKAYTGATKQALVQAFQRTPYRLACTATPAPNDYLELGNHAEFLGVMASHEMLMRWFINDSMKAGGYRLKGHAESDFWAWVTSWAACVSRPSDLGYPDDGYDLPALEVRQHLVSVDPAAAHAKGMLFDITKQSATRIWRRKATSVADRADAAAALVAQEPDEPWIVWCDTNAESSALVARLPADATVEVRGSESPEAKEAKLRAFSEGRARIIVTKSAIAGFGLNWQHCARQCFVGLTYSFESFYQALRRSYRFGQRRPVIAHLIVAEGEADILATIQAKQQAHRAMQAKLSAAQRVTGLLATRDSGLRAYDAPTPMQLPAWLRKAS